MDNFICKVANRYELLKRWEYLVEIHPGNNKWKEFKENALKHYDEESTISYLGFLNDEIICEATAYIKDSAFIGDISEPSGLLSDSMAYLAAFRTNKGYEGKGYFSKLYKFVENDLKPIVVDLLGIDKPRSWKYEKINNKEVLVHRGRKGSLYPDKALEDMMDALKKKKFNVYRVSNCPYAFVNNLSFYDGKCKEKESLGLTRALPPKDSELYASCGYLKLEHEYDNWVNKIFPAMPEIVQECFRNDPTYKTILLSEDEGIMLSYQSPSGCGIPYNYNESTFTAILKLTGKVIYEEKDDNNQKDIITKTKDINKRISFLKSRYKKLGTLNVIRDNSFYLDDKNEPYGIIYFDWKRQVNLCKKSKEYNIPTLLIWLL